jgi:hypothetical protein
VATPVTTEVADVAAADSEKTEATSEKPAADKDEGSSTAWWMSP